jgi:hypothetical protein
MLIVSRIKDVMDVGGVVVEFSAIRHLGNHVFISEKALEAVTRDVLDRRANQFVSSREVLTKRRYVLELRSARVSKVTRSFGVQRSRRSVLDDEAR